MYSQFIVKSHELYLVDVNTFIEASTMIVLVHIDDNAYE